MIIIFDTETNGLPKNWKAPTTDIENWPRMIQIAWRHYADDGRKLAEHCYIIKPEGFTIPDNVAAINRITTERAEKEGVALEYALMMLSQSMSITHTLVAHNISFDEKIVGAELLRAGMKETHDILFEKNRVCTMMGTVEFCDLPGQYGKKWPKLQELYTKLFNEQFEGAHDALSDVEALSRCFFALREKGVLGGQPVRN